MNFDEFVRHFTKEIGEHRIRKAQEAALGVAAQIIAAEARRVLGTYDYNWPQLADSTQRSRESLGFPPNEPGLRTGQMRDSIEVTVISDHEAEVGSNEDKMLWFEIGTATQPPRPTLAGAAAHKGEEAAQLVGRIVGEAVAGASIDAEIAKLALKAVKDLAHTGKELLESGEDDADTHRNK